MLNSDVVTAALSESGLCATAEPELIGDWSRHNRRSFTKSLLCLLAAPGPESLGLTVMPCGRSGFSVLGDIVYQARETEGGNLHDKAFNIMEDTINQILHEIRLDFAENQEEDQC